MALDSGCAMLKQDLADLDKGPDSRCTAMDALKGHVEQLDTKTMGHFLDQVSDTKESETSRQYAISLYIEVARAHKHDVIPFIPRIMSSILRTLPSSGGSEQLQQACAKVVTSVARYTMDPTKSPASNEEILRKLFSPLLQSLSSKPEPLAVGAAVCLQALVESEKWKCAPLDLQELICAKAMAALTEKSTQTVAHMHLMRSLAKFNSCVVQGYVAHILRAGVEILLAASLVPESWKQRLAAAQLLGSVLKIADTEILDLDLSQTISVLEAFQRDKVAGVRTAAVDAVQTAKTIALEKDLQHEMSSEDAVTQKARILQSKKHYRRKSSKTDASGMQELEVLSDGLSPDSSTASHGSLSKTTSSTANSGIWPARSPLFPVKQFPGKPPLTCRESSSLLRSSSTLKENAPATRPKRFLSDVPTSCSLLSDSRDLPAEQMSKELSPVHKGGRDSGGLSNSRASFSDVKFQEDNFLVQDLGGKVSGNNNGEIEHEFCLTTARSMLGSTCNHDLVRRVKEDMKNGLSEMMGCMEENSDKGKDAKLSGEFESCKDRSRCSTRSIRLAEDVLCNGCRELLLTPAKGDSESLINSENGDHIQMSKNKIFPADLNQIAVLRQPVQVFQSDSISPKSKGISREHTLQCPDSNVETMSETSWSMRDNPISAESEDDIVSRRHTGTASSSCCSLEELDWSTQRAAQAGMQSEGLSTCRSEKDGKCPTVLLDTVNMQAAEKHWLSVGKNYNDLSSVAMDERIGGMQVTCRNGCGSPNVSGGHFEGLTNVPMKLDGKTRFVECRGETTLSVLFRVLQKGGSLAGSHVVSSIVILLVAIAAIRYLSKPQDLHVLLPT